MVAVAFSGSSQIPALWRVNRLSFGTAWFRYPAWCRCFLAVSSVVSSKKRAFGLFVFVVVVDDDFALGGSKGNFFLNAFTRDDFDDDDAENWEDCLLHARGVLDGDIAKTIFVEDFANMMTRSDDSSEERKKCVWLFFLC